MRVHRAPLAHPPLQGSAYAGPVFGMAAHEFLKQRYRAQARCLFQQRNDLLVEDPRQGSGRREEDNGPPDYAIRLLGTIHW